MAATVISLLGDDNLPQEIRLFGALTVEPWQTSRSGLMIISMDPTTDFVRVSQLIQNRTTYWDVAVCIPDVLSYYAVALMAQGAVKILTHPEENLEATKRELRSLLRSLSGFQSDSFGLEVSDLIQLYGEKRVAKTIRITGGGTAGSIFMNNGNVAHCETMDDVEGMPALQKLLAIDKPEIRIHKGCLTEKKSLGIPAMGALLEGSRQMDESSRDDNALGSRDAMDIRNSSSLDGIPMLDMFGDDQSSGSGEHPKSDNSDDVIEQLFNEEEEKKKEEKQAPVSVEDEDLDLDLDDLDL